jgi:hypothetical protein
MGKAGGKRPGSGRKKKIVEDGVRETIKAAIGNTDALEDIWRMVIGMAKTGSDKHINILFNYYYGKPKDNEGEPSEMIIRVQRNG